MPAPLVILGGGALALYAYQSRTGGDPTAGGAPRPVPRPIRGSNNSSPVGIKVKGWKSQTIFAVGGLGGSVNGGGAMVQAGGGSYVDAAEIAARQKLKELEERAKREFDALDAQAKARATKELNDRLGAGLTGDESWAEASKKVGAAIGATAAMAGCNAIPIPGAATVFAHTVCATLGAMVGAYLGEKLGTWGKEAYAEITSWADRQWGRTQDAAEDAAGAVAEAVEDAYDYVKFW